MATQTARESFVARAPAVMAALIHHTGIDVEGAAAILGNIWAESKMRAVSEAAPTVKGSLGGYGWSQSTGARRRAAFAFWKERNLDPSTDAAQIAWLIYELTQTPEKKGIVAVMRPGTLQQRTKAFELAFERAGVKNYTARYEGARIALAAYNANPVTFGEGKTPAPAPVRQWTEDKLAVFEVRAIQTRLKALGFGHMLGSSGAAKDGVDGDWGAKTAGAIFALQTKAGITADGHYGPQTQAVLARGLEEPKAPSPAPSDVVGLGIEEGLTRMIGSLISLVGGKTIVSLVVALAAPYAAKYGIGEESINKIVGDLAIFAAALGSADASKKAVARAAE